MNAPAPDIDATAYDRMEAEWDRMEALALCLTETRQGREPPAELLDTLSTLQDQVGALRAGPSPWRNLDVHGLTMMEMDILSAIAAADLQPRVGWLFQTLQGGAPFASAALLQDMLALRGPEVVALRQALSPTGRLAERRLIREPGDDPYGPLRIDAMALAALIGAAAAAPPPPGATLVRMQAGWPDLILPPLQLRMLEEFLLWVTERDRVVGEWGGRQMGGPLALFSGPSGTGKTFAASVIAGHLGWPLYRVDLGMIVSKYIGETEKNLNALFDVAHGRPMVLQFDEADSLLGKRAEVKEARDRYANMEVSHLLSRIERHKGPCILTTNLRQHLDTAFMRRFQAVIEFPRPDAGARARLWRALLPKNAPLAGDLDLDALAEAVVLTGGAIQNAALHAAYLAAEGDAPIGPAHIAVAIWRELGKSGKPLTRKELGPMADHLPEGGA